MPCPLAFETEDLHETVALQKDVREASRGFEIIQSMSEIREGG